jgi:acyl-CoA synthetase (AMP-forming)/AMP-acid ligase II
VHPDASTVARLLRRNRDAYAAKRAVVTDEGAITHADLEVESRSRAARLAAAGTGKGARIGLLAPNGIDWAVTAAAAMRIGAVLVPLSTLLRPPELEAQLRVAGVTHLVFAPSFRGRNYVDDLEVVAPGVVEATRAGRRHPNLPSLRQVWPTDCLPTACVDESLVGALEDAVGPADDLVILFTSGSRGTPKGTIHTHGSGLRAVTAGLETRCIGPDDRVYIPMPLFWSGGFASGLLSALVAGATLLTEAVPEPGRTLELLVRERATLFRGWPDQAARLAADPRFESADLSCLGPASLPAVLPPAERPAPGARANLFGMTETFGPYCGARLDRDLPEGKHGSCGQPFAGFELRITDASTDGPSRSGTTGEVRVRGPNVMRALAGRTRDATFDPDGFYPTGDLGALDGDGYLWYRGRVDDMFKVRGATVYPAEVEAALRQISGVREAHVTNVAATDGTDAVGALVVTALPLEQLVAGARGRLSTFKVPTRWVVTGSAADVPLTATSKVDLDALRGLLDEGTRA